MYCACGDTLGGVRLGPDKKTQMLPLPSAAARMTGL